MRHAQFHSTTPPTPSLSRSSSSLLSRGSLPLGAKILRSYTPRALLRRTLTVELQIVIFCCCCCCCCCFVVSNFRNNNNVVSNFRISTTIRRITMYHCIRHHNINLLVLLHPLIIGILYFGLAVVPSRSISRVRYGSYLSQ